MPGILRMAARRRRGRSLLLVLPILLAAAAAAAYWLRPRPDQSGPSPDGPAAQTPPPAPLCEGWESPAAVLVLTGEQHGTLEPCGCTERQTGGLERRADLVRQLREERRWNVAALDLGGALHSERVTRAQERMKFETTRAALREMKYDAMAWGPEEIRLKAGTLYDIYQAEEGAGDTSPPFVCANVLLFGEREMPTPVAHQVITVGTEKVAVTAVLGESEWKRLFPEGAGVETTEYGYEPPAAALERVLPLMDAEQPTVRVLLAHAPVAESRQLAEQFPQFDLVVTAGGNEDGAQEPETVGRTWLLRVGQKGKHAGVVGFFREGGELKLRFELASLDKDRFAKAPAIHDLLRQYVDRLGSERPDRSEPGLEVEHPAGEDYVGAETCGTCHKKAYAVWSKSSHSHAYESLETGGVRAKEGGYLVRIYDAECLCCHTTGWNPQAVRRYRSGFVDVETTPHLAGQQCENCHGPGSRHVELEQAWSKGGGPLTDDLVDARRRMQRTKDAARKELCIQCHDADNSPTFDTDEKPFETYWWPKIAHPGKD